MSYTWCPSHPTVLMPVIEGANWHSPGSAQAGGHSAASAALAVTRTATAAACHELRPLCCIRRAEGAGRAQSEMALVRGGRRLHRNHILLTGTNDYKRWIEL